MPHVSVEQELEPVRAAVQARGLLPVARDLGMPRSTLASVLSGAARPGTVLLVLVRWESLHGGNP